MIEVSGLTKRYGTFTAVKELSFTVQSGEVMGLVGPNGAGKTTSLRCAAGIIPPTVGTLRVCGIDLAIDPVAAKRQLAFLPDEPRLFDFEAAVFAITNVGLQGLDPEAHLVIEEKIDLVWK